MNLHVSGFIGRLALAFIAAATLGSCGSGAVSGSAPVTDPTRITVLPSTATLYSGLPTTFVISGGTGSYIVSSSNQAVLPVSGSLPTGTFTLVPNPVAAETTVTLTVRDTGTTPVATSTLTVRPGTVSNDIVIAPTGTQGGDCSPNICSGSDALVTATLGQGGLALSGRAVRFDAVSGDFRFITSASGSAIETLDTTVTVLSDEAGKARARIRVLSTAQNQTALLQVTDISSGAFQRTGFTIAQATGSSPGFFATPAGVTFAGRDEDHCAQAGEGQADIYIFGGTPPYNITTAGSAFFVTRSVVSSSGGSFSIQPTGTCVAAPGLPITISDASGRTTSVTAANILGTRAVPALVVAPNSVSLSSCLSQATVTAAGGTGSYVATAGSGAIFVTVNPSIIGQFFIRRNPNSPASTTPLNVGISDGRSVVNVTVNLTGPGAGICPEPAFTASPNSVNLNDCTGAAQVNLAGGSGAYSASSGSTAVSATITGGNVLSIQRVAGSAHFTSPVTVVATDGTTSRNITVNWSGAAPPAACP